MSAVTVTLAAPDALAKLSEGLVAYQRLSGKLSAAILVQKGGQLVYGNSDSAYGPTFPGLSQLFLAQAPKNGAITAAAKARGFKLGAISLEARKRAAFWMGGYRTILARPGTRDEGRRLTLGAVRAGPRRGRNGFRVLGGRKGRGGTAVSGSGLFAYGAGIQRQPGEKILNRRAVETLMEINLRESGRRFLGSSFLFRRWRRLAASSPLRTDTTWRILENRNPRSALALLGTAALEGREETGDLALRITSYVPGVQEIGESRGLFARAIGAVRADLDTYLARKHDELLRSVLLAA